VTVAYGPTPLGYRADALMYGEEPVTSFRYLRAAEWGMRWARPPIAEKLSDPEAYVHHSAGAHVNDAVTAFRALNEYAINTKGYSALDYDVLVHRDKVTGLVTIGGGREGWLSAATLDRNELGEAICVLGYFQPGHQLSRQPHDDEIEGVALAIVWGIKHGWISPDAKILGHRDNPAHPGATSCPGDYLQAQLPTIRARVAELLAPPEDDMEPLDVPDRVYDSRQTGGTFAAGEVRKIPVGICRKAFLHITAVGSTPGYVSISGTDQQSPASLVNFDTDHIESDGAPIGVPDGHVRVFCSAPADIIVDVYARG
jgi:hypothetical protein